MTTPSIVNTREGKHKEGKLLQRNDLSVLFHKKKKKKKTLGINIRTGQSQWHRSIDEGKTQKNYDGRLREKGLKALLTTACWAFRPKPEHTLQVTVIATAILRSHAAQVA